MKLSEKQVKLLEAFRRLRFLLRTGSILIVEGARDKAALESLGVEGRYMYASTFISKVMNDGEKALGSWRSFIILTDFDREGGKLHSTIKTLIIQYGGHVDETVRNMLALIEGFPRQIQGVAHWIERNFCDVERFSMMVKNEGGY